MPLTDEVKVILKENALARKIVGKLLSTDIPEGIYGDNPTGIQGSTYNHIEGHEHEEVYNTLKSLQAKGFLKYIITSCGPGRYAFKAEYEEEVNRIRIDHDHKMRRKVADFLKQEFPDESLLDELNVLRFKLLTTDEEYSRVFDISEVAEHYAKELGVQVSSVNAIAYGHIRIYEMIREWIDADQPFVVMEGSHGINMLLAAEGFRVRALGKVNTGFCDMTRIPNEYSSSMAIMSADDPFEDPFLCEMIGRYDESTDQRYTSTVHLDQIGLRYQDPMYVLERLSGHIANKFTVASMEEAVK